MYKIKLFLVVFVFAWAGSAVADHLADHNVEKRIKPSGSVYLAGDDVPVSKPVVVKAAGPRSAEDIYQTSCSSCHATEAIGAPMFGNPASWADRLAKGEEEIINNAINGLNAMPPMGTCGDCSKNEIIETVKYMLANSK